MARLLDDLFAVYDIETGWQLVERCCRHAYALEVVDALRGVDGLVRLDAVDGCRLTAVQSAHESGIHMLAVEVEIPDANGFASAPSAAGRSISGTPLADAPLLLGWNDTEELLDDPLV